MIKIPFLNFEPVNSLIKSEMLAAFERVYDSNWFILGGHLSTFEAEYAKYNNSRYCIGVSNGLDALHLSLKAIGVGSGDEVIVPSNTYIATALAVSYVGAKPVFVEPNFNTYNIDVNRIEDSITSKTKAIIPVHLYGQACEMESIMRIADNNSLFVIEDNAQSHGSNYIGKSTGSWGHVNATSFYPGKNIGALGDAGAITTDIEQFAKKIQILRNYGSEKKYYNELIGHNMRMDEVQAALLSIKLNYISEWTSQRKTIAKWYNEELKNVGDLILPSVASGSTHVYHLYVIRTNKRDALKEFLTKNEIGTLIHYPIPVHLQKAYQDLGKKKGDFPLAEILAETCLSLPMWPGLKKEEISYISNIIRRFFNE